MLPIRTAHSKLDPHSVRSYRGNTTILIVDDNSTVLAILKAILTREGYRTITATSPGSAIELASINSFDMLITDFQMPETNGFVLASRLAKNRVALPVLMISGSDPYELPMKEIAERHWNFMSKPIDRERLLRIIDGECLGWSLRKRA